MRKWGKLRSLWDFWLCKIILCCHVTEHCNRLGVKLPRNCHWMSNFCPSFQNDEVLCPRRRRWLCSRAAEEHPSQGEAGLGGDAQRHGKTPALQLLFLLFSILNTLLFYSIYTPWVSAFLMDCTVLWTRPKCFPSSGGLSRRGKELSQRFCSINTCPKAGLVTN